MERARDIVPTCMELPVLVDADSWLITLWRELRSGLIGSRERFVRMRLREAGAGRIAEPEVWRRLIMIDRGMAAWSLPNG